jgi:hypothetical protein
MCASVEVVAASPDALNLVVSPELPSFVPRILKS